MSIVLEEEEVVRSTWELPVSKSALNESALFGEGEIRGLVREVVSPTILVEGAFSKGSPVGVGVVTIPGAHETNQGREPKPKTGGSRPGSPYQGTTPTTYKGTGTDKLYSDFNTIWEVEDVEVESTLEVGGGLVERERSGSALKEVEATGLVVERVPAVGVQSASEERVEGGLVVKEDDV